MGQDIPPAPPEAEVIRLTREATGMTAQSAAEASKAQDPAGRGISAAYWRDVERGHGGRRGERVATRASARALAAMARVVGAMPAQLTRAGREDAARVLEEIMRRVPAPPPPPFPLPPPTEAMARQLAPFLAEAEIRVKVAQDAHPGQRLTGKQVYPDLPEGAAYWDSLIEARFPPEQIGPITAVMLARSAEQAEIARSQDGHAAGLIRHLALRALR